MYKIIKYATKKDLDNSFIYFISNNFYNNIFSNEIVSKDFLLLIEKSLSDEINNLKDISDFESVMSISNIFILLSGLNLNKDIKYYFDYILSDIIENYEKSGNNKIKLTFNIDELSFNLINTKENNVDLNNSIEINKLENFDNNNYNENNSNNSDKNFTSKDLKTYNDFTKKYLIEISKIKLVNLLNEYKNNEYMKIYINNQINKMKQNNSIFSNNILINEIKKTKKYDIVLNNYQKCFNIVIEMMNNIINKILDTSEFIPYAIKYVCKTIYNLLIKKFNNKKCELIIFKFISNFFFIKLFQYFFLCPEYNSFFDSTIISIEIKNNLLIIFNILKKFISNELYENDQSFGNYIPFNLFFLENTNKLFQIYEKLLDINSPKLIQFKNDINNDDKKNIQPIYTYSICLTINNLTTLLNIIKHNNEKFFINEEKNKIENKENIELKIIYDKLKEHKEIFKTLKEKDDKIINCYVFHEAFYSELINNILFNSVNCLSKNFKIPEINKQNYIVVHTKNLICDILSSTDLFNIKKISNNINLNNFKEILTQLSIYYTTLNSIAEDNIKVIENEEEEDEEIDNSNNNNYNKTSTMQIEWHINSLIINLNKLNNEFKENNYKKLLETLIIDINNSINKYDFKILGQIKEKLNIINKNIKKYLNYQKLYKNICINTKVKKFIDTEIIEVKIKYKNEPKDKAFRIKNDNMKNKNIFLNMFKKNKKDNSIKCLNIYEFCSKFPYFSLININKNLEIILTEDEKNILSGMTTYFDIIKQHVDIKFKNEEKNIANNKIQKFIMESIYDRLFPKEQTKDDISFYFQTLSLFWIEPKHLDLNHINFYNYLEVIAKYFNKLDNEHWPKGKFKLIEKIFNLIENLLVINKMKNSKLKDIKDICEYFLIKSLPERFVSNLKYLQMFLTKSEESNFDIIYYNYLMSCMNNIKNYNFNNLKGITSKEFAEKCIESNNKYFSKHEEDI